MGFVSILRRIPLVGFPRQRRRRSGVSHLVFGRPRALGGGKYVRRSGGGIHTGMIFIGNGEGVPVRLHVFFLVVFCAAGDTACRAFYVFCLL